MAFWIAAAGIGLAVTALLALTLWRGQAQADRLDPGLTVYRDQLREVERDLARGVVTPEDAGQARLEVQRRLLDADRSTAGIPAAGPAPRTATLAVIGGVGIVMTGAVMLYLRLGAPGYPDMPIAARLDLADRIYRARPAQAAAEQAAVLPAPAPPDADFAALMDRLRAALKTRPDDLDGFRLLARNEAGLGNYKAAIAAQNRVVAIRGAAAAAEDHAALGELMILAAGGYVSPEAEAELVRALRLDPLNGTAGYYAGLMFVQTGRPDRAFALWAPLLQRSSPDAPWVPPIRAQIEDVAAEAGQRYALPDPPAGPTRADMDAAADLSPEARQTMIRGMVAQLNDRLASQGGSAEDWARLIAAYGVLGEPDRARAIWTEAQGRFAGHKDDLARIRAAATEAGVAE